ncbi:leucine rich repeat protein [Leptospira weilii serovar Topaz str. LT2116]|uniref:Leucine rich repeat protein n=1 Tax=Leptospira weilii serovar Topaz str. LT2116 TaxID=1088540 RepID=M3GVZ4_9LEPT|nr:leucine rich repeat protein [Leptospira weilii serovar Topaz str. LT2116]
MNFQSINNRFKQRSTILLILICISCKLQAQSNEAQTYSNLTEALKNPKDVRQLDLAAKGLTALPKEIGQLRNLQTLNLGSNRLTIIPEEIAQLRNLQELYAYGNRLTTFPEEITQLQKLQGLDLGGNQLNDSSQRNREITEFTRVIFA